MEHQDLGERSVLSISARECFAAGQRTDGGLLRAGRAVDVLAEEAWRTRAPAFDAVYATVYRAAEDPHFLVGYSKEFGRDELTARWGARPESLDTDVAPAGAASIWPWVLLPLAAVAYVLVMVALAHALRSGRVVIYFVR